MNRQFAFTTSGNKCMRVALLWLLFALPAVGVAQVNNWQQLADVRFKTRKDASGLYDIDYPVFGPKAKALAGTRIRLKGYMVPLDNLLGDRYFVLSSLPFNVCFFCGGAGPETVVEVFTTEEVPFTDDTIWVEGRFELNADDPERMMYLLKEARVVAGPNGQRR